MSESRHENVPEFESAPFTMPGLGGPPLRTLMTDYPVMPPSPRPQIQGMAEFARFLDPIYESPFGRDTYCNAHRSLAMQRRYYQEMQARELEHQAATMPRWILDEDLIPHQVPPGVAVGWFTGQFMQGEASLISLARTLFGDEASVETVFTGQPERMWETSVMLDRDVTVFCSNTLADARQTHTGAVARIMAHGGMEPTHEVKKLAAAASG